MRVLHGTRLLRGAAFAAYVLSACTRVIPGAPGELTLESRSPVVSDPAQIELGLRNGTPEPLVVPRPADAFLLVAATSGEGRVLHCRTPPAPPRDLDLVTLEPGEVIRVPLDPFSRCERGSEQDLRITVRFAVPPEVRQRDRGERSWVGSTAPVHLQVLPAPVR